MATWQRSWPRSYWSWWARSSVNCWTGTPRPGLAADDCRGQSAGGRRRAAILTVGAELSLAGRGGPPLGRSMTELAVNAGVVLALSVALVLVRRFARLDHA